MIGEGLIGVRHYVCYLFLNFISAFLGMSKGKSISQLKSYIFWPGNRILSVPLKKVLTEEIWKEIFFEVHKSPHSWCKKFHSLFEGFHPKNFEHFDT